MWKPNSVIDKHRRRATGLWGVLLLLHVAYIAWNVTDMLNKRKNPATSVRISNNLFQFPNVAVCFHREEGCTWTDESEIGGCVASALTASSCAYGDEWMFARGDDVYQNCVHFDLSLFNVTQGEARDGSATASTAYLWMDWITSDNAPLEESISRSNTVHAYIYDDWEAAWEFVRAPYSRNVLPSDEPRQYERFFMKVGRTERNFLSGEHDAVSTLLDVSPSVASVYDEDIVHEDDAGDDYFYGNSWVPRSAYSERNWSQRDDDLFAFLDTVSSSGNSSSSEDNGSSSVSSEALSYSTGTLMIEVRQGSYSYTEITDIDPLNIPDLLGNIGGFWGYLLLVFAAFFVAVEPEKAPKLRARAFYTKSGAVAMKQYLTGSGVSASRRVSLRTTPEGEQLPDWEQSEGKESETDTKAMKLVPGQHYDGSGSRFKRPLEDQAPRRRSPTSSYSSPSSESTSS